MVVEFSCPNIALASIFINIYNIKKKKKVTKKEMTHSSTLFSNVRNKKSTDYKEEDISNDVAYLKKDKTDLIP